MDDESVWGMKKFSIHRPETRDGVSEYLVQTFYRDHGGRLLAGTHAGDLAMSLKDKLRDIGGFFGYLIAAMILLIMVFALLLPWEGW